MAQAHDIFAGGPGDPFHIPPPAAAGRERFQALLLDPGTVVQLQPGPIATWPRRLTARLFRLGEHLSAPPRRPSPFEAWVEARVVFDPEAVTLAEVLYRDYLAALGQPVRPLSRRAFADAFAARQVARTRAGDGHVVRIGVRLIGSRP